MLPLEMQKWWGNETQYMSTPPCYAHIQVIPQSSPHSGLSTSSTPAPELNQQCAFPVLHCYIYWQVDFYPGRAVGLLAYMEICWHVWSTECGLTNENSLTSYHIWEILNSNTVFRKLVELKYKQ